MPYINVTRRHILDSGKATPDTAGELNYTITQLCETYRFKHKTSYATFNDIIGALECAKQEYYRRMIAPYEDTKIIENGDVY